MPTEEANPPCSRAGAHVNGANGTAANENLGLCDVVALHGTTVAEGASRGQGGGGRGDRLSFRHLFRFHLPYEVLIEGNNDYPKGVARNTTCSAIIGKVSH